MKFAVTVTLKKDVLDPQGKVVSQTLKNMGIKNLNHVRQGKFFEIDSDSIVYTSLKLIGKEKEAKQFSKNKDIFTNQGNPWQI